MAEIFRDRFFISLGLTNTLFPEAESATLPPPSARGYVYLSLLYVFLNPPYRLRFRPQQGPARWRRWISPR